MITHTVVLLGYVEDDILPALLQNFRFELPHGLESITDNVTSKVVLRWLRCIVKGLQEAFGIFYLPVLLLAQLHRH